MADEKVSSKDSAPNAGSEPSEAKIQAETTEALEHESLQPHPFVSKQSAGERFKQWCRNHKKTVIVLSVVIVLGILVTIPYTRYKLAGLVLQQTAAVQVLDQQTYKPVSSAKVTIDGKTSTTDTNGMVNIRSHVGTRKLTVSKPYYHATAQDMLVPIFKPKSATRVNLKASGRQVMVTVVNTITGKPVANVKIKTSDTEALTGKDGQATIVLPATKQTVSALVSAPNFNTKSAIITVAEGTLVANKFSLTPAGKVYFLSNQSGNIDVVKTDLDGSNRQTVLAGTGKEDKQNTVLLASRDWKYLALLSKRDGGNNPKLFLINTPNDNVTTMDEGNATFTLIGWSDHRFVYDVLRNSLKENQSGREVLKSYDADAHGIAVLDQNQADGDAGSLHQQIFTNPAIIDNKLVYVTQWFTYFADLSGKSMTIRSVGVDGQGKKDLKTLDALQYGGYPQVIVGANSVYYSFYEKSDYSKKLYLEYEDGAVNQTNDIAASAFDQAYPTYLVSPSAKETLWSEVRDGKNTIFVGNKDGKNGQQLLAQSEQIAYGWFTDAYVLTAKSGSELYIMGAKGGQQIKVTDYYKPAATFRGYGGGYGGL